MAKAWMIAGILLLSMAALTVSDFASDQKECGSQLVTLASCIPYVKGSAKMPAKDCCDSLLQIHLKNPKCLCVLIKDSSDPQAGITINETLALQLPKDCNVASNISKCPGLLHMSPDSPDAQIFKDNSTSSSPASAVEMVAFANTWSRVRFPSIRCQHRLVLKE
eukprot:Gb_06207 [translate_table: standard]